MARYISDGVIRVHAVSSIANRAAPTVAEINAGTELTGQLLELDTPLEGSIVDAADASSKFNKTASGNFGGQPLTATFYRDKTAGSDTAFNTLPRGTVTHIVVARRGYTGAGSPPAVAAGDKVDVYKIDVVSRNPSPYARNEMARFAIQAAVTETPEEDVAVA